VKLYLEQFPTGMFADAAKKSSRARQAEADAGARRRASVSAGAWF